MTKKKPEKKRVIIVLTDEMHTAIKRQAARRGATISGFVRAVLGEKLQELGEDVEWMVEWGGRRGKPNEESDD